MKKITNVRVAKALNIAQEMALDKLVEELQFPGNFDYDYDVYKIHVEPVSADNGDFTDVYTSVGLSNDDIEEYVTREMPDVKEVAITRCLDPWGRPTYITDIVAYTI